ncbi:hypothetical protein D9615_005860 [Tricholomella constricta]|uniref:Uncharacterized protein n=1 Tax=Tricholomella constricta TaxID=117010 RepID=A0A8H5H9N4_9AGAR|nr:hypothetical protein D9615_005860 [Tricholomella constricta]
MPSDVFRPRLPLDPFAALEHPPLWPVTVPDSPSPLSQSIIVLGAPSHTDLAPLVTSPHLAHSLVVIATHTPPPVPTSPCPAVIILHLPAPLDIHDSGAVRLVGLLDRAQRVAHAWRTATLPQPRIQQLAELYPGGDFTISEEPELAITQAPLALPCTDDAISLASSSSSADTSTSRSSSFRNSLRLSPKPKTTTESQFTALINFLPPALPDKALLKHAILVTTLAAPFLTPPTASAPAFSPYRNHNQKSKRQSIFSSLSSLTSSRPRPRLSSLFGPSPPSSYPNTISASASSPPSLFSSRAPSAESLALPKSGSRHPHLIHVLPYSASASLTVPHRSITSPTYLSPPSFTSKRSHLNTKPKLAQSIEQFLLSFAYPPTASASSPALSSPAPAPTSSRSPLRSSPLSAGGDTSLSTAASKRRSANLHPHPRTVSTPIHLPVHQPRTTAHGNPSPSPNAVPFLLPAGVLGSTPALTPSSSAPDGYTYALGELVLLGALDAVATGSRVGEDGVGGWPRAWVGAGGEIEFVGGVPVSGSSFGAVGDGEKEGERGETAHGKGKGKEKAGGKGKEKGKGRVRRNEAGLPTPPESSSSLDGESGSEEDHHHDPSLSHSQQSCSGSGLDNLGSGSGPGVPLDREQEAKMKVKQVVKGKGKRGLRTRVSRFFGVHVHVHAPQQEEEDERDGGGDGGLSRFKRALKIQA